MNVFEASDRAMQEEQDASMLTHKNYFINQTGLYPVTLSNSIPTVLLGTPPILHSYH